MKEIKEEADRLVELYFLADNNINDMLTETQAKQCALICVDECLKIERKKDMDFSKRNIEYWQEVKQEIEKL